jgi:hypothetical protein
MARILSERIERGGRPFKGLSDKSRPDALTPGECVDLINVDFFEDAGVRRGGVVRKAGPLRSGSVRLDGVNDYLLISNRAAYQPTTVSLYLGIGVVLRKRPTAAVTILSWGFGAALDLLFDLRYDPAAGTGALGAWVFRVRDSGGAVTRTLTLDDGDGFAQPQGVYRFIEFAAAPLDISLTRWDDTGTITSTTTGAAIAIFNWASAQKLHVGVGTIALNAIDTDFSDVTLCELRYAPSLASSPVGLGLSANTTNKFYIRELTAAARALCAGYWKFNDGDDRGICVDQIASNHAVIPNNPPPWVRPDQQPLVLGQSAVEFKGGNQWVDLRDTTSGTTTIADVFTVPGGSANGAHWTVRTLYIPLLPPGATAMPNGAIAWAGADAAIPAPISIRVVSDRFEFQYRDGGATATLTASAPVPLVSALAGKQVRLSMFRFGTGNGTWGFQIAVNDGNPLVFGTNLFTNSTACAALNPGVTSQDWALGNHITNFASARLGSTAFFGSSGALWGVLDDFQIVKTLASSGFALVGVGGVFSTGLPYGPFAEVDDWNGSGPGGIHQMACYVKFNDGAGTGPLAVGGYQPVANGGWQAYLRPQADTGASWDIGLVDPQTPNRASLFKSFDRFVNDRLTRRDALVACGTTLYAYDVINNALRIVGPLPARAEAWTSCQFGQRAMLAGPPGRRPVWTNGDGVYGLGIEPPQAPPIVTLANAGGTFTAGTYYLYVRYRNRNNPNTESNPSPATVVTFSAGNDTISSLELPVSSDPQVNQRRVFMTALGGADGDVAYLVATIDDNTTTTYGTDILNVSTSSESFTNYLNQAAAPAGTVIAQFKDYTLIGGSQDYPTRLYFSQPTVPDYWLPDDGLIGGDWEDLDLDTGRPITAITSLLNSAMVDFSDGRAVVTTTGDTTDPIAFQFTERASGAVGPQAVAAVGNAAYILGENGIYFTTGYDQTNLSGPGERNLDAPKFLQDAERPSISRTILRKIDGTNRSRFVSVSHPSKSQVWFAVNLTSDTANAPSNTTTLVYDIERRIWSKYDVHLDCADKIDDATGSARLWGVVDGYICQLDEATQAADGFAGVVASGTVSSVSGQSLTVTGSLGTVGNLRFLNCYVLIAATGQSVQFQLRDNPDATTLIAADGVSLTGIANGDVFLVGGIPCFMEMAFRFGSALNKKRMKWLRFYGECTVDPTYLRVAYKVDENRYDQTISGWSNEVRQWAVGTPDIQVNVGGIGGLLRVRFGEQALSAGTPTTWMPAIGSLRFAAIEAIAESIDVL